MLTVCKVFSFHAAHKLPNHPGYCKNLHGHTYKLEVEIASVDNDPPGMLLDFGDLKKLVNKAVIDRLDHSYINELDIPYPVKDEPTAENMVCWIRDEINLALIGPHDLFLKRVRLWETDTSYAEWVS